MKVYCCCEMQNEDISIEDAQNIVVGLVTDENLAKTWNKQTPKNGTRGYFTLELNDPKFIEDIKL